MGFSSLKILSLRYTANIVAITPKIVNSLLFPLILSNSEDKSEFLNFKETFSSFNRSIGQS